MSLCILHSIIRIAACREIAAWSWRTILSIAVETVRFFDSNKYKTKLTRYSWQSSHAIKKFLYSRRSRTGMARVGLCTLQSIIRITTSRDIAAWNCRGILSMTVEIPCRVCDPSTYASERSRHPLQSFRVMKPVLYLDSRCVSHFRQASHG